MSCKGLQIWRNYLKFGKRFDQQINKQTKQTNRPTDERTSEQIDGQADRHVYPHTSQQSPVNWWWRWCWWCWWCWPWASVSEMFATATNRVIRICLNIFISWAMHTHTSILHFKATPTTTTTTITGMKKQNKKTK